MQSAVFRNRTGPRAAEPTELEYARSRRIFAPILPVSEIPNRCKKAKSDFYWEDRRAGHRVEAVIGIPGIGRVSDHEYRAALYSLAVAIQIAGSAADRSEAIAIGKAKLTEDAAIYVLLGPVDSWWGAAVSEVGIVTRGDPGCCSGAIAPTANCGCDSRTPGVAGCAV